MPANVMQRGGHIFRAKIQPCRMLSHTKMFATYEYGIATGINNRFQDIEGTGRGQQFHFFGWRKHKEIAF
jgi:hypothetical protein